MTICANTAKHLREVYFGGNWTWSNLRDQLKDVTWEEATRKIGDLNTIATLTYHIHYFTTGIMQVLQKEPLTTKDALSFSHPPINNAHDWEQFREKIWREAETLASLIDQLPDDILAQDFSDKKYGSYFRNFHGFIEHTHYHLGQIALIKKLVKSGKS